MKYEPGYKSIFFHFLHLFLLITFSIWSAHLELLNPTNARQYWIIGKSREIIAYELRRWILSMTALYKKKTSKTSETTDNSLTVIISCTTIYQNKLILSTGH